MAKKILAIMLVIATLASCGNTDNGQTTTSAVSESSATTTTEATTTGASTTQNTTTQETTVTTTTESTTTITEAITTTATEATTTTTTTTATSESATTTNPSETTTENKPGEVLQPRELTNENATKEAVALYNYISEVYHNGIISGQQESTWKGSDQYEFDYIYAKTGKYPAMRGLDYMNDDFNGVNRRAKEWHDRGGIVTICWHCGSDFSGSWSESMNTDISDWDKALTEGTPEYEKLIKGMDKGAEALKKLQEQNIPVLWRPFHELDGGWFWWGKGGAENFRKLWIIMYDRYTNYHGLNNLIWVLGYSGNGWDYDKWYPGDEYVDIAGADSYNDGANGQLYVKVSKVVPENMPICFHECGRIPTVEQLKKRNTDWVWFMTWHTDHITGSNNVSDLKAIYNEDYVITLDELPDLY